MIIIAVVFDSLISKNKLQKLVPVEWVLLAAGAAIIYYTYTVDFGMILIRGNFLRDFSNLAGNPEFLQVLTTWVPAQFNWALFSFGCVVIMVGVFFIWKREKNMEH
jgi:hypothetical protein